MALVSKYKTLKEFRHEQKSAYNRIVHNGWNDLLEPLARELHPDYNFSIEEIKAFCEDAGDYKTLKANHPEILNYCWYKKIDIYESDYCSFISCNRPCSLLGQSARAINIRLMADVGRAESSLWPERFDALDMDI